VTETADTPAPPKPKAKPKSKPGKKKAAKRERKPKAAKKSVPASGDQLQGLSAGARVVVNVGRKKQTVSLVKVKRTRFFATSSGGKELDLSVEQFIRTEE
jgi:hypothetical protein